MLITNWHHISEDTRQNYNKKNLFYEFEELFLILMHPCAVTHSNPNLHLIHFCDRTGTAPSKNHEHQC